MVWEDDFCCSKNGSHGIGKGLCDMVAISMDPDPH